VLVDIDELVEYTETNGITLIFVYIKQAHSDKWPLGNQLNKPQPITLSERIQRGSEFAKKHKLRTILFDGMDDEFNKRFACWPHRLYVVNNGKFEYIQPNGVNGLVATTLKEDLFTHLTK
jgi:hypothetical protein